MIQLMVSRGNMLYFQRHKQAESKRRGKNIYTKQTTTKKENGMAILMSGTLDFKTKNITRDNDKIIVIMTNDVTITS